MARGGARRQERGGRNISGGNRVNKQKAQPASTGGPKPMEIGDKMSASLDDIIKQERTSKPKNKPRTPASKPQPSNKKGKDRRPLHKQQNQRGGQMQEKKGTPNLQITVNAGKVRDRPILNQIISHAELNDSRTAPRSVAPRMRDRVQPVSLDYQIRSDDRHRHTAPAPSNYAPRRPTPMDIDGYYDDRDARMRRY